MKRPMTVEEALAMQARIDKTSTTSDAYENADTEWKAARFAMSILRSFALKKNISISEAFEDMQKANAFEDYLLWNYQVMHSQDAVSNVTDVSRYIERKEHAI